MDNALVATGLSVAVTLLTSLFKTVKLSTKQKTLIATVLSVVAGVVSVVQSGVDLSAGNVTATAVAIYGASQIAYQFILKGTKLNESLTNVVLFGKKASEVEKVLKAAEVVESVTKKSTKKTAPAKKASPSANSKRVKKD